MKHTPKKLPINITITRPNYGDGRKAISIELRDELSHIRFCQIEIAPEDMMEALTGLGYRPCTAEVLGLEFVGKTRVTEPREILCHLDTTKRDELSRWLESNAQEDGWMVESYLGSKGSVSHTPEGTVLRYSVTKYVDQ